MATPFLFTRTKTRDVERQLKYEKLFSKLLNLERFKKGKNLLPDESQSWVGRVINSLKKEGSLNITDKEEHCWSKEAKDFYYAEWVEKKTPLYQIKTIRKDERPREKLLKSGEDKVSDAELLAIFL